MSVDVCYIFVALKQSHLSSRLKVRSRVLICNAGCSSSFQAPFHFPQSPLLPPFCKPLLSPLFLSVPFSSSFQAAFAFAFLSPPFSLLFSLFFLPPLFITLHFCPLFWSPFPSSFQAQFASSPIHMTSCLHWGELLNVQKVKSRIEFS